MSNSQQTGVFTQLRQDFSRSKMTSTSVDSGNTVALTLFNTIYHSHLNDFIKDWFGIDGTVLTRKNSYLTNYKQKIKLRNSFSEAFHLPCGIPKLMSYTICTLMAHR